MSERTAYLLIQAYREVVVRRGIDSATVAEEVHPGGRKLDIVMPAIKEPGSPIKPRVRWPASSERRCAA